MRIGLIGSGNIGGTLARLFTQAGHDVWLSNSRGPDTLRELAASLGGRAHAASVDDAAAQGQVVVVTIPVKAYTSVPVAPLAGKVVIDTTNYYPERDGRIPELDSGETTSSELLARHLPGARVVKTFNSIYFRDLADQGVPAGTGERRALPMAGDDAEAKAVAATLVDEIGFDVVDAGPLAEGRRFQPDTPPYTVRLDVVGLRQALGLSV